MNNSLWIYRTMNVAADEFVPEMENNTLENMENELHSLNLLVHTAQLLQLRHQFQ